MHPVVGHLLDYNNHHPTIVLPRMMGVVVQQGLDGQSWFADSMQLQTALLFLHREGHCCIIRSCLQPERIIYGIKKGNRIHD